MNPTYFLPLSLDRRAGPLPGVPRGVVRVRNASPAAVNTTLTHYAAGLVQDMRREPNRLAEFLAPWVVTGVANGQFKRFNDKKAFQIVNTRRAIGAARQEIKFDAGDPFFHCLPHGLQASLDDFELEQAGLNAGVAFPIKQSKVNQLVNTAMRSREYNVIKAVKDAKAATAGLGHWSDDDVDPIAEIDSEIMAIGQDCGQMPNRLAIGATAWGKLRNHPLVKARKAGVDSAGLTLAEFAAMLYNPSIEIRVGMVPFDSAPEGVAQDNKFIVGDSLWIFIGKDNPDVADASFAKTFSTRGNGVDQVKEFRIDDLVTKVAVDWSEDVQVVGTLCGRRVDLS
jgi:hypothetical protein